MDKLSNINENDISGISEILDNPETDVDQKWLVEEAEKFCQDKAVYNAIMESIQIIDGSSDKGKGALPDILNEALAVSFRHTYRSRLS